MQNVDGQQTAGSKSSIALWLSFGVLLTGYMTSKVVDPDLWWHITAGKWILAHGALPDTELWNRFSEGEAWTAYSWSAEILFAAVDKAFGLYGLYSAKVLLALTLVLTTMYCLGRVAGNMVLGAFLSIWVVGAYKMAFTLRPQCISWVLLVAGILAADAIYRNPKNYKGWIGIILVPLLWANLHLTTLLGIGAVLLWIIDIPLKKSNILLALFTAAVMFAATLCTPYMGSEWLTLLHKVSHPFVHSYIREFQPTTIFHPSASILIVLVCFQALLFHYKPDSLRPMRLLLALVFCFGGIAVMKFMPFAMVGMAFLIASTWADAGSGGAFGKLGEGIDIALHKLQSPGSAAKASLSIVLLITGAAAITVKAVPPLNTHVVPEKAVDYIIDNDLPMPILNGFGIGGYLIYRFSNPDGTPRHLVPVDGRTNVNDPNVTKAFVAALNGTPQWTSIIDVVQPRTIIWKTDFPLIALLLADGRYRLVYPESEDKLPGERYAVFVETTMAPPQADYSDPSPGS